MNYNIYTLAFSYVYGQHFESLVGDSYQFHHFEDIDELYSVLKGQTSKSIIFIALEGTISDHSNVIFGFNINKFSNIEVVFVQDNLPETSKFYYGLNNIDNIIGGGCTFLDIENMIFNITNHHPTVIKDDNFTINLLDRTITYQNQLINATDSIYTAIIYFVNNPGRVISTREILTEILDLEFSFNDAPAIKLIERMRKVTNKSLFRNLRGQGYIYGQEVVIPNPTIIDPQQDLEYFPGSDDHSIWQPITAEEAIELKAEAQQLKEIHSSLLAEHRDMLKSNSKK